MLKLANSLFFRLTNNLVINILRFFVLVIAARMMTKEQFGLYTFVFNLAFLAVALANLGLPTATTQLMSSAIFRLNSKEKAKGVMILAAKFRLYVTTIVAMVFLCIIISGYVKTPFGGYYIWILAIGVFLFKSLDVWFEYVFASLQEYKKLFLGVTLPRELFRILLTGGLIIWGFSSLRLIAVDGLLLMLSMILAVAILSSQFQGVAVRKSDWRPFIVFALSIAPTSLIALSYERINIVILGKYVPMRQLAEYNAAYQFTTIAILLIPVGSVVILPTFMSMSRKRLERFVNTIIRMTLVVMLPVFFGLQIFGDEILFFFYGEKYIAAAIILDVFAFLLIERIVSPTLQNVLLSVNKPKAITGVMAIGGGINVILAIILVQKLGAIGAAIALVIARYVVLAALFIVLMMDQSRFQFGKYFAIIGISALFLGSGIWVSGVFLKVIVFCVGMSLYGYVMVKYLISDVASKIGVFIREHHIDWRNLLTSHQD